MKLLHAQQQVEIIEHLANGVGASFKTWKGWIRQGNETSVSDTIGTDWRNVPDASVPEFRCYRALTTQLPANQFLFYWTTDWRTKLKYFWSSAQQLCFHPKRNMRLVQIKTYPHRLDGNNINNNRQKIEFRTQLWSGPVSPHWSIRTAGAAYLLRVGIFISIFSFFDLVPVQRLLLRLPFFCCLIPRCWRTAKWTRWLRYFADGIKCSVYSIFLSSTNQEIEMRSIVKVGSCYLRHLFL